MSVDTRKQKQTPTAHPIIVCNPIATSPLGDDDVGGRVQYDNGVVDDLRPCANYIGGCWQAGAEVERAEVANPSPSSDNVGDCQPTAQLMMSIMISVDDDDNDDDEDI